LGYLRCTRVGATPAAYGGALRTWLDRISSVFGDGPRSSYFTTTRARAAIADAAALGRLAERGLPISRYPRFA